jgi:MFS family permease
MMNNTISQPLRSTRRLVWGLAAAIVAATAAAALWQLREQPAGNVLQAIADLTQAIVLAVFGVTGALILSHQPRNAVGRLMMLEGTLIFAWPVAKTYESLAAPPAQPSALFLLGLWFAGWSWLWLIFPLLFVILYFPTGRLPSPRWRWLRALGLGLVVYFMVVLALLPELNAPGEPPPWTVPNPIGIASLAFSMPVWSVLLLTLVFGSVASLFVRFRRADPVERSQLKWLLYAGGVFLVVYAGAGFGADMGGSDIFEVALVLSILSLPVAIAVAILRYRLYDIDLVIRKTLLYAVLTALLALVYFGSVILLQQVFGALTGIEQSTLAVVISTLAIAALFTPLRRRVQDAIDRRFYRKKYDAQQVLAQFAQTARDETDLDALLAELVRVVDETLQPEHVSVWLRPQGQ